MGNYKFRLTDMIPNAWLYKLMDMRHKGRRKQSTTPSKRRSLQSPPSPKASKIVPNRASYYISSRTDAEKWYAPSFDSAHCEASDAQFILDTPRRSKRLSRVKPVTRASAATVAGGGGCGCRSWKAAEPVPEFGLAAYPESPSCQRDYYIEGEAPPVLRNAIASPQCSSRCKITPSPSPTDIIIDVSAEKLPEKLNDLKISESEIEVRPILTKPARKEAKPVKFEDNEADAKARRRSSSPAGTYRLRLRTNSPRLASKKTHSGPRRGRKSAGSPPPAPTAAMPHRKGGFSESLAVVKTSSDPQRDFRDSMLEMIVEHDMRTSKDLEELLACYLLLNSSEYHDVIVKAFRQIWFDLTDSKL